MTADEQHTASLSSPITHSRRGLHGHVVDVLGQRIISGELSSGTVIEPDRLVTELQVSRTVVREVIKVLTTKGLLDARPRTGTYVLPRSRWNLLDADVIVWRNARSLDARLLVELEEVRQIIEPWGARLAAMRRSDVELEELERALAALEASTQENHESKALAMLTEADVRFHRGVLAAAGNELLERLERLLEPALRTRDELAFEHEHGTGFLASHRHVVDCIREQRPDEAFEAMSDLLRAAAADTDVNLGRDTPKMTGGKRRDSRPRRSGRVGS